MPEEDSSEFESEEDEQLPYFDEDGNMRSFNAPQVPEDNPDIILTQEEREEVASGYASIEERAHFYSVGLTIREIIDTIGDDPTREGLIDTPNRVLKSWNELYSGYQVDIKELFTVFEPEQYSEMVLLKDIEFYSMCEHHMLPFYGVAHVAYIPKNHLVGISKLARVVEAFSRRLQNQERLADQIASTLDLFLSPEGAACVIEGKHMCMACRGVKKGSATMITSSLRGVFKTNPATRAELFSFIKG